MGKFNDCNSHLHVLTYVMSDNKREVKRRAPNTVSNTPTSKASIQVYEDTIVSEDEAEFLKSQPLNMPESLSLHHHGDGCASPAATTNRRRGEVPKSWLHSVRCNCVRCQDIASHALSLQLLAVQSDSCLQQGRLTEASTFARILVRHHDNVAEKAQHVLRTSLAKLINPVLPSMFEHVLLDGCVLMAQLQSDVDAALEWLHRAEALLDVRTRPRMVEAHAVLARLHYQMALSAVPWPRYNGDVAETTVEKLCSQIGRITIAGDDDGSRGDSGEFQTPLVTKLNLHSVDRSGDEITPENASTMDQGEGGQVDINTEESAGLDRVGFAPKKKRGRVVRGTAQGIDAQKLPFSAGEKSTSKVGKLPSRGAKIANIESVALCSEDQNVDLNSPKAEVRAPVRKTRAVRKCPNKRTDAVTNGCDKEVDNKPSNDDCRVTETGNSTPDHSQISDQVKVVTSDEKPISAKTSKSVLATKTKAKTHALTESDDDDNIPKTSCSNRSRVARKGVSCSTQTSRGSSRQAKTTVYVDTEGTVLEDSTNKSGRAGKSRTRCVRKTSAKTSARCGLSPEKDISPMVEEDNIDKPEPCDSGVTIRGNRKGSKSKSTARKAAAVKTSKTCDTDEPVQSLFKEALTESNVANDATVFDFDCTTPVQERHRNAASHRKGRLTLKKKAGRPKTDVIEVEMARDAQEDVDPSYDDSEVVLPEMETSPVVEQVKVAASSKRRPVRSKRAAPSRTRVTRSRTGFVEEIREQSDEEEEDVGTLLGFDEVPLIEANDSDISRHGYDEDEVTCEQIVSATEFSPAQSCGVDMLRIGLALDVVSIDHVDDIAMPDCRDANDVNIMAQSSSVGFVSETLPLGAACLCLDDSIEIALFGSDSDTDQPPLRRRAGRCGNGGKGRRVATETARASQGVDPVNLVTSVEGTLVENHVATLPPCLPLTGE